VIATLHEMLPHERHAEDIFATLCALTVSSDRRSACVRLAGHPSPILLDERGVRPLEVDTSSPPLGLFEPHPWPGTDVELGDAWSLLLFTDGLIEGRIADGPTRLGEERLVEILERHVRAAPNWRGQGEGLLEGVIAEVERLNGEPLTDDLAVVLLSVHD
jgi:serine phosphatase RsbU (regulator of sigma subunit)